MFYRLQVIVNDLKSLGEKVEDKDFSHRFLRCLPPRFDTLVTILVRDGLENMTPNQKKGYGARRRKASSKNKEEPRRCFKCKSKDHLFADYPYNSDDDDEKNGKKDKKDKKMAFKKKNKGHSYCVTWDSDASSSDNDDDDSDDERKTTKKKAIASIAINNKPPQFDAPSTCFMAKATKVQSDDERDSESEDDEEYSKEDLMELLQEAHSYMDKKRKEFKELHKKHQALEKSFDELNATHERLVEAHEKLEKAHSSLVAQDKKEPILIHYYFTYE
ncbi:uncharacterized protein [Miscanthus floridulus]|uniref:uncharacterized protein n=1 Tax=Miscanthus floridulus TaxID=154761 RepID=UPI003459E5AA